LIISASRRTDIPAFYTRWFMNRIRAGYCTVPNPFNRRQVSAVSLTPENVDAFVFWTRNPQPLIPYLTELDRDGHRYLFNVTVMANPRVLDAGCPDVDTSIHNMHRLSERISPEKIIWRYDPIVCCSLTPADFHRKTFARIAKELQGCTTRCIISTLRVYRKSRKRLQKLADMGVELREWSHFEMTELMRQFADSATRCGMEIFSCAQENDLTPCGIKPGKCIDDGLIAKLFGIPLQLKKDPTQREKCGCVASKDIGMYDSCLYNCCYCYATSSIDRARINHVLHDADSPSLLGWHSAGLPAQAKA
jgi:hypothetical protein